MLFEFGLPVLTLLLCRHQFVTGFFNRCRFTYSVINKDDNDNDQNRKDDLVKVFQWHSIIRCPLRLPRTDLNDRVTGNIKLSKMSGWIG